jgi:uncharacterized protein with FMN-binding domain
MSVQAGAQSGPGAWDHGIEVRKSRAPEAQDDRTPNTNTTVIERASREPAKGGASVKLVALLTSDGQQIDQGLVWRVFQTVDGKPKLLSEHRDANPALKLKPGDYTINAAFGRANLTRKITVKPDAPTLEQFVLNAGGLRLSAFIGGEPAPEGAVLYSVYADDRDQFANRTTVMTNAKPNLIIRLNAGIYHLVSSYGDANAKVETDVTVEAGKLTETQVAHSGGTATLKLVARRGGEAVPDTRWIIRTAAGEVVKESVGALPAHVLAPGKYIVTASSAGNVYRQEFEVKDSQVTSVEVLMDARNAAEESFDIEPSLDLKNP